MTREEFDNLDSNGRVRCPDCGLPYTKSYANCGCPWNIGGYGIRHINKWHHDCKDSIEREKTYHLKTDVNTEIRSSIEERLNKEPQPVVKFTWKDPFRADTFDELWQIALIYGSGAIEKVIPLVATKSKIITGILWVLAKTISVIAKRYSVEQKKV